MKHTQKDSAQVIIDYAVELSRPTRERHRRLNPKEALTEACRANKWTSGNWGYWIHGLKAEVAKAIGQDEALYAQKALERKSRQKSFSLA